MGGTGGNSLAGGGGRCCWPSTDWPVLLLPVVGWWCWRRPTPLKTWLLATAVVGFVLPLVVQYARDDAAMAAFSRTAGSLWLVLCALTAVELTQGLRWSRMAYALLGAFVLGSTYMGISFAISLWPPEGLQATAPPLRPAQVQLAARVAELVPPGVRILSDNPRWVTTLAGRLAPSTLAPALHQRRYRRLRGGYRAARRGGYRAARRGVSARVVHPLRAVAAGGAGGAHRPTAVQAAGGAGSGVAVQPDTGAGMGGAVRHRRPLRDGRWRTAPGKWPDGPVAGLLAAALAVHRRCVHSSGQ